MFSARSRVASLALVLSCGLLLVGGSTALAQPAVPDPVLHAVPGSILIFPLFDSNTGRGTLITVTNTDSSRVSCGNFFMSGDVCLHYTYVGHDPGVDDCNEFDRLECLTPGDTLTVLADEHNPQMQEGWLWVQALDPETLKPIVFNSLIGSAVIVDSALEFVWSYTPYAFRAPLTGKCPVGGTSCGSISRCYTDFDDESDADFDGTEYERFPDKVLLDQFFEEANPMMKNIGNELSLMTTEREDDTNVSVTVWNDSEQRFSRGFVFRCHFRGPLSEISQVVKNLGGTDPERFQTGWIELQAAPGILGVFKTQKGKFGAGKELFLEGTNARDVSIPYFDLSGN